MRVRVQKVVVAVAAVFLAALPNVSAVSASPIPYPPELWFIDPDGSNPRTEIAPFHGWGEEPIAWSPDGREFAFRGQDGLYVRNLDTDFDRQIATSAENPTEPAWSPDGDSILYAFAEGDGFVGLRAVSPEGTDKRTIYQDQDAIVSGGEWSPDSTKVVIARGTRPGTPAEIYVVDLVSGIVHVFLGTESLYVRPAWSPQGDWIAYTSWGGRVTVVRPDGREITAVSPESEWAQSPDWAPDGRLAFAAASGIYVGDPDSAEPRLVVEGTAPDWSPDGTEIAYVDGSDLWVMTVGSGATRQLTSDVRRSAGSPSWSPDGDTIAFLNTKTHILCPGFPYGPEASIVGTNGDDELEGTPGSDVIAGLGGDDQISGGGGDDVICGGSGQDVLFGQDGFDTIHGEADYDVLEGGSSDDILDGGTSYDEIDGNRGNDTVAFFGTGRGVTVNLSRGRARGVGRDVLFGIEDAWGTPGPDKLVGDRWTNVLRGSSTTVFSDHADVLIGKGGPDELYGDAGNDTLRAGPGNDYLDGDSQFGGQGADKLFGGQGRDTCVRGERHRSCERHPRV